MLGLGVDVGGEIVQEGRRFCKFEAHIISKHVRKDEIISFGAALLTDPGMGA